MAKEPKVEPLADLDALYAQIEDRLDCVMHELPEDLHGSWNPDYHHELTLSIAELRQIAELYRMAETWRERNIKARKLS